MISYWFKQFPIDEHLDDFHLISNDSAAMKFSLHWLLVFLANTTPQGDWRSWIHTPLERDKAPLPLEACHQGAFFSLSRSFYFNFSLTSS